MTRVTRRQDLDLNLLRVLDQLLKHHSVSRAAEALGVTQAATSNTLRRLREHFGDELLVRNGGRMAPTKRAEQLRPDVEAAATAVEKAFAKSAPFVAAKAHGAFRIATSDHIDAVVVEPLIRRIAKAAPDLQIVMEPISRFASERLRNGDLELLIAPRANFADELRTARLLEEPFAVVMRRRHPFAAKTLSVKEYAALEHVVVSPGGGSRSAIDRALAAAGLRRKIKRYSAFFSYALLLVADTDLAATVPCSMAQRYASLLRLRLAPLPVAIPPVRIDMGWSARVDRDPLHQWIRRELVLTARKELAGLAV